MKHFAFIFIFFTTILSGQVYISSYFDSLYVFGPDNVSEISIKNSKLYISDYQDLAIDLKAELEKSISIIREIKLKPKKKWKDRRKLRVLKNEHEILYNEYLMFLKYIKFWENKLKEEELKEEFFIQFNKGNCVEIYTDLDTVSFDQYDVEVDIINDEFNYFEYIDVEVIPGEMGWVKKETTDNCLSHNPEDGVIWCKVRKDSSYRFNDYFGETVELKFCPEGFKMDLSSKKCFKEYKLDIGESLNKIELINKFSGENLSFTNWKVVDCK